MGKCPYCGAELKEGDKFCATCGADVTQKKESEVRPRRRYREEREACFGPRGSKVGLWGAVSGGVFLLGLAVLWYLDQTGILHWWPGVLILIAIMMIIGGIVAYTRRT